MKDETLRQLRAVATAFREAKSRLIERQAQETDEDFLFLQEVEGFIEDAISHIDAIDPNPAGRLR